MNQYKNFHFVMVQLNDRSIFFNFKSPLVTSKRRNTQNASRRPVWPPLGPSYVLSEAQSICYFPDLLQLGGCCAGPHNATCDHTDGEYEPHASQHNKQLGPWPQIETSTVHRHSQTPRTNTKRLHKLNFLSFISWKSPRQHKLPYFCHHLICPICPWIRS